MSAAVSDLRHQPLRGVMFMLISLACFTGNALLLKYLASQRQVDPWLSLSVRAGIGLLLTVILFARAGTLRLRRAFRSRLLASRGVLGALSTACFYLTIGPLGAGKATLISNTWCIFAAIMAGFILHERLGRAKIAGILLALAGLCLLTGLTPGELGQFGREELLALVGAVMAAGVIVVIRELTRTESSATIFASQCLYLLLLAVPIAAVNSAGISWMDASLIGGAGFLAGIGQLGMTEGFRFLTVASGGAFQLTVPLVISLCSVALFAEPFTVMQVVGGVLVLWGCFQTVNAEARRTLPAEKGS